MSYSDLDQARYFALQAYDRITVAQHYYDTQTLQSARMAILTAYLVLREVPRALCLVNDDDDQVDGDPT